MYTYVGREKCQYFIEVFCFEWPLCLSFLPSETDYPPKANAGSNVILSLPQNSVTLYGNSSTDDKGIASYEWIKKSNDKLTADMTVSVARNLLV